MDWDLKSFFSEFGAPTYVAWKTDLDESLNSIGKRTDQLLLGSIIQAKEWEALLIDFEHMLANFSHISGYLHCLTAAEATNDSYLKEETAFADMEAKLSKVTDKVMRGLASMSDGDFEELANRERLEDGAFRLRELRDQAQKRMPGELEDLAADLGVNGISAWSRLYFTSMGKMKFRYNDPDKGECEVPISQYNSLLSNPNRMRRRAAYEGAIKTFAEHQQTYASALNAISGTRHTLNSRRGIGHFLEPSLRQSRMSSTTLEALMLAIDSRLPFAREVFSFRNKTLGIKDPSYFDLRAPLPMGGESGPEWEDGVELISNAFNGVYPALGAFFDEMVEKKWIDHTPRNGKRPGGFCTGSLAIRESRIFMTYKDTLNDVLTLAHEAGHAWHSRLLKDQRVLAARYPMTLAESASTFAERILTQGVLADKELDKAVKLVLLDAEVEHMLSFLLDLPVRFRFERAFYEERQSGALSSTDLCSLMRQSQREVFGDSLAKGGEDPWFWVSKLHFYIDGVEFYNYPYTFGYLLSTAYVARFRDGGNGALNTYERFLENSGKMNCEQVVKMTLSEDIEDPNFWAGLIDQLVQPFSQYKELLKELTI